MGNSQFYAYTPDYAVHPGEYLEEVLEAREMKKNELASRLGISVKHLSQIINKKASINSEMALQLQKILKISANIWINMNSDYELFVAKDREKEELKKHYEWLKKFPLSDLKKINVIPDTLKKDVLVEKLLEFFAIPSPEQWEEYYNGEAVNFRKSEAFKSDLNYISTYIRVGEVFAKDVEVSPYSKDVFKENLNEIRKLCAKKLDDKVVEEVKQICADSGVALVFVPAFKKTNISGVTKWLTSDKALIIMSFRHKTNDHFWFTFFHEAAHVLLHGKKEVFVDNIDGYHSDKEEEANNFSAKFLIPEKEYDSFCRKTNFEKNDILMFAKKINIHPGIVVGRLQHDKVIGFNALNEFKEKVLLNNKLNGFE